VPAGSDRYAAALLAERRDDMTTRWRRGWRTVAGPVVLLLAMTGCARLPTTAAYAVPPIPVHEARIWFYRDQDPNDSQAMPLVRLNDAAVGVSQAGGAFYRDVPAGHYHISVDSHLADVIQTRDVDLAPGQEAYAKVLPLEHWIEGGGGDFGGAYRRDTFYVWLYPVEVARPLIAQSSFYGDGTLTAAAPPR
jgi:hypothetical protein